MRRWRRSSRKWLAAASGVALAAACLGGCQASVRQVETIRFAEVVPAGMDLPPSLQMGAADTYGVVRLIHDYRVANAALRAEHAGADRLTNVEPSDTP